MATAPSLLGQVEQQLVSNQSAITSIGGLGQQASFMGITYTVTTSNFTMSSSYVTAANYATGNVIMESSNAIWTIWVQGDYQEPQNIWQNWSEGVALTQEAVHRQQEMFARQAEIQKEADAKRAVAEERAKKLLITQLDERQAEQFHKTKTIDVISRHSRRTYRLRYAWTGNVDVISPEGKVIERMCIHPSVHVPMPDHLLAQKLMIEHDEESFRKIANITRVA